MNPSDPPSRFPTSLHLWSEGQLQLKSGEDKEQQLVKNLYEIIYLHPFELRTPNLNEYKN